MVSQPTQSFPDPRLSLQTFRRQVDGSRMDTAATARRPPKDDIETSERIPLEGAAPSAPCGR
jgi:hypothetical protein